MREVKVGLVGFGFSGATFHAPVIEAVDDFNSRFFECRQGPSFISRGECCIVYGGVVNR